MAARAVRIVSAAGCIAVGSLVGTAAPAAANTPDGWEETDAMPVLDALLLFVGAPLLIAVVLALLVMAPSAIRGDRESGRSRWSEPQWFGAGDPPAVGAARYERAALEAPVSESEQGGGAGARW